MWRGPLDCSSLNTACWLPEDTVQMRLPQESQPIERTTQGILWARTDYSSSYCLFLVGLLSNTVVQDGVTQKGQRLAGSKPTLSQWRPSQQLFFQPTAYFKTILDPETAPYHWESLAPHSSCSVRHQFVWICNFPCPLATPGCICNLQDAFHTLKRVQSSPAATLLSLLLQLLCIPSWLNHLAKEGHCSCEPLTASQRKNYESKGTIKLCSCLKSPFGPI